MSVINSAIFLILERFPDRKDLIRHLFGADANFRILCEDFRQCSEALEYWEESKMNDAPDRREEYRMLQRELAGEIIQLLGEAGKPSPPLGN